MGVARVCWSCNKLGFGSLAGYPLEGLASETRALGDVGNRGQSLANIDLFSRVR